ncbi:MAG: Uma2 family endonuclease [Verrucomicrobiota bacterium]
MVVATLSLQLPPNHLERNRKRWSEVLGDAILQGYPGKVETNRHGHIVLMAPASGNHSVLQGELVFQLRLNLERGVALPECPISTMNGVRAADVGWYSKDRFLKVEGQIAFEIAPEICVEILSPSNSKEEMREKFDLYFEAGAKECWLCSMEGELSFFSVGDPKKERSSSQRCPTFPRCLNIR